MQAGHSKKQHTQAHSGGKAGGGTDLQGRQASFDERGLAVLDNLVEGFKVLVPKGEDHPPRVEVLPSQPHCLLTAGLHLFQSQAKRMGQAQHDGQSMTAVV